MPASSRTTHTPGPWTSCKGGACECGFIWDASEEVHVASAHDVTAIGTSWYGSDVAVSAEERQANAQLIAAAPELLAALKRAVADAATASNPSARLPNYEQACAAIAKAEGIVLEDDPKG